MYIQNSNIYTLLYVKKAITTIYNSELTNEDK